MKSWKTPNTKFRVKHSGADVVFTIMYERTGDFYASRLNPAQTRELVAYLSKLKLGRLKLGNI